MGTYNNSLANNSNRIQSFPKNTINGTNNIFMVVNASSFRVYLRFQNITASYVVSNSNETILDGFFGNNSQQIFIITKSDTSKSY